MEFIRAFRGKDILNSEGPICELMINVADDLESQRLFIKSICLHGRYTITTEINQKALELYLQSRLNLIEIFQLQLDKKYFLRDNKTHKQYQIAYDYHLEHEVLRTIECGRFYF